MKPFRPVLPALLFALPATGFAVPEGIDPFLETHCYECHADGMDKGGLDFDALGRDLSDPAVFAKWEYVFDRVENGEMPPEKVEARPTAEEIAGLTGKLGLALAEAHTSDKGTVLRRLNRREFKNTLNDLFGTHLDLAGMLPEDGRSHEFDNVGEALGISMTHLERYLDAARLVWDSAVAKSTDPPEVKTIDGEFREDELKKRIGITWKHLDDGAIVRFEGGGYPSGLLRNSGVRQSGWYRVKVTGYAYQSEEPVTCSIGGESYKRGSDKPVYTFAAFPPGQPTTVELKIWIEENYMLVIEPQKIALPQPKPEKIDDYGGPGFAFLSATIEGPLVEEFPSRGHWLIFEGLDRRVVEPSNPATKKKSWYVPEFEIIAADERAGALQSIKRVAARAWRRPVSDDELETYLRLFEDERAGEATFEESLRTAVTALFVSPNFLYLRETPGRLDDFAVVNRLSYFLNRTAADAELLRLASQKNIASDPEQIRAQTERLLANADFGRFLTDFSESWLNLREMDFTVPDRSLFPEFDLYLRHSMPLETEAFLRELVDSNLPIHNLMKSDFAMLNGRLADLYDIPNVNGPEIRRIDLPKDSLRGGFLSQASILKVSANGTNTSPVLRGVWVLERILNEPPKPPPPGIPGVEPDIRGAKTLRQLLDQHRDSESCATCHQKIDPPGFALESFDPIGRYREKFRALGEGEKVDAVVRGRKVRYRLGPDVDSTGSLPDGRTFSNFREFRDLLAADEKRLAKAFVSKLLTFATGREMGFSDRAEIDRIVTDSAADGYRVRDLIHLITSSEIFLSK